MDRNNEIKNINVRLTYPKSDEYEFFTKLETIDLDKEARKDIESGNGFVVSSPRGSKKDLKDQDGIYSSRFGQKLGDVSANGNRYSCECGYLTSRINHKIECPVCRTKVRHVGDNYNMFGWIILKDEYHIIHPKYYNTMDYLFGNSDYDETRKKIKSSKLKNMLNYSPEVDQDGQSRPCEFKPEGEPFYGIGMLEFYERFDEILQYYYERNPKKKEYYDDIVENRSIVFCHSIPVFTTYLRPTDVADGHMFYEPSNAVYKMMAMHVHRINKDGRKMDRDPKVKNAQLYKVQKGYMELYDMMISTLSGKYGELRSLTGCRYNFSSRAVIRQDASLRVDQVILPYVMLAICLQQRIINILIRSYNMSPSEAYRVWKNAVANSEDEGDSDRIGEIINAIIRSNPEGLPCIINRNPTLSYGSVMQMWCIGYSKTLTMSVSLQCLVPMNADFDGDVLNIFIIIMQGFLNAANRVFNPRNAMYISRVDGKLNNDIMVMKDTLINANTLMYLGRKNYSSAQMEKIRELKQRQIEKYYG